MKYYKEDEMDRIEAVKEEVKKELEALVSEEGWAECLGIQTVRECRTAYACGWSRRAHFDELVEIELRAGSSDVARCWR